MRDCHQRAHKLMTSKPPAMGQAPGRYPPDVMNLWAFDVWAVLRTTAGAITWGRPEENRKSDAPQGTGQLPARELMGWPYVEA